MEEYYVEQIIEENGFYKQIKWGVFRKEHSDTEMLNKPKDDLNLIVWTYEKIFADKIAEMLNVDEYVHERYLEEN